MDEVANSGLTGSASVDAENAGRSRTRNSGIGDEQGFADIFAAINVGGERQYLAGLSPWITVPVGTTLEVITTAESPPDDSSLRDFAIAQGFDAAALSAIFGSGVGGRPAQLNVSQGASGSSGAEHRSLMAVRFQEEALAFEVATGDVGVTESEGAVQSGNLIDDALLNDPASFTKDVSFGAMAGAARALKIDQPLQNAVNDKPATGICVSVQFSRNPEIAAGGGEMGAPGSNLLMEADRDAARVLHSNKHVLLDAPQVLASGMGRSQAASFFEFAGHVIVPASLHAMRAGWSAGLGEGAGTEHVDTESDVESLESNGMTAINAQTLRAGVQSVQGPTNNSADGDAGGNVNVLLLGRMAAEVAEERLGVLVAQRMVSGIRRGEWRIHLLLRPESLGEVRIEMRMQGNAIEAQLSASHDFTKNILNQGLDRLRDCLRESGMEFAFIRVSTPFKEGGDGKPTGRHAEPSASRTEIGVEDEDALSSNSTVRTQSGSQWDMFV